MISIGILGYGYWAPNLVKSFAAAGYAVTHIADRNDWKLKKAEEAHPGVSVTRDLDGLVRSDEVDAVVVALPTSAHYEYCRAALINGKHVLTEKPMTDSYAKAVELKELADKNGLVFMVDHHFIYKDSVRELKEIADSGRIGRLCYYNSTRANLGIFRRDDDVILDLAPHDISIVKYITGRDPVSVWARGSANIITGKTDDAYVEMTYDGGFKASFRLSWVYPCKIRDVYLGGDLGTVHFNDMQPEYKNVLYPAEYTVSEDGRVLCSAGKPVTLSPDTGNALASVAAEFAGCIEGRRKPLSDAEFGASTVKTIEKIRESLARGTEVGVED